MKSFQQALVIGVMGFSAACAGSGSDAKSAAGAGSGAFTYAPTLNAPYHETMQRYEEMSIPGTPIRDAERWTLDWDVVNGQEKDLYKRTLKLVGLKLNVNGVDQLRGDEIKPSSVTVDVLTDKDSNVVDVRGTDQMSAAIVSLGTPDAQPVLKRIFSPERLKALVVLRSIEQHADFVGHPAAVGSTWTTPDSEGTGTTQIKVVSESPCGSAKCVSVERTYSVDKSSVFAEVQGRVADYVQSQGGDPTQIKLVGLDVKLQDSLVIDPMTMDYHGAHFGQDATLHVAGPKGELPVALKIERQSDYKY
jgi:hypothetical protein